jgi:TolB-like protein/DNA-binding winged helix-turn-helix (wHTH) protein
MNEPAGNVAAATLAQGFALGELQVEPQAGEVVGPGGRQQLDPKVMGVLRVLAEQPHQVVSREVLLSRLWPNVVVSDDALTRCLSELRRQLRLAGGSERYRSMIETLPKRGYRLNADISVRAGEAAAAPRPTTKRRWWPYALAALAVLGAVLLAWWPATPRPASVAVIPFTDMSPGQDQGWFADGIAEEILNHLSQSKDLRVIGRTSSFALRDDGLDVREIARRLDVTHVLEGSVRKSGEELRVTAQLISGADGSHVWSHTFEKQEGELFAIQDEIATGVATALDAALVPRSEAVFRPSREGHENFLRGEFYYNRRAPGDFDRAIAAYLVAVAWQEKQRLAAQRAVELDPKLAIAHIRLAQYFAEIGQRGKGRHFAIARQLDPGHPIVLSWGAEDDVARGDFQAAIGKMERAVVREPLHAVTRLNFAILLLAAGQLDRALREYRLVLELSPNDNFGVEDDIARIFVLQRRYVEARQAISLLPDGKRRDHGLALLFNDPASRQESDAALARLGMDDDEGATEEEVRDTIALADAYAVRGDLDRALLVLRAKAASFAQKKGPDSVVLWYLRHEARLSPFLRPLREDPRWQKFLDEPEPVNS